MIPFWVGILIGVLCLIAGVAIAFIIPFVRANMAKNTAKTAHYRPNPSPSAPLLAITLHPDCSTLRASPEPKIELMIGEFPARHRATSELHRLQRPECRDLALPFGKDKSHAHEARLNGPADGEIRARENAFEHEAKDRLVHLANRADIITA